MTLCILCRGRGEEGEGGKGGGGRVAEGDEREEEEGRGRSGEEERSNHIPFNAQQKSLNTCFVPLLTLI